MIKKWFLVGVFLLLGNHAQAKIGKAEELAGFRGIKWGTDFKDLASNKFQVSDPGEKSLAALGANAGTKLSSASLSEHQPGVFGETRSYSIKSDSLDFEGIKVDEINYLFKENKFSGVLISAHDLKTFEKLKNVLFKKFGETPLEDSGYIAGYRWNGSETEIVLLDAFGGIALTITSVKYGDALANIGRSSDK